MARKKKKGSKIRTDFRKRHDSRTRKNDFTREFHDKGEELEDLGKSERVSGKGDLTRKRTVIGTQTDDEGDGFHVELDLENANCLHGRVIRVHGLNSIVRTEDGRQFECAIRGVSEITIHGFAACYRCWRPSFDSNGFQ